MHKAFLCLFSVIRTHHWPLGLVMLTISSISREEKKVTDRPTDRHDDRTDGGTSQPRNRQRNIRKDGPTDAFWMDAFRHSWSKRPTDEPSNRPMQWTDVRAFLSRCEKASKYRSVTDMQPVRLGDWRANNPLKSRFVAAIIALESRKI